MLYDVAGPGLVAVVGLGGFLSLTPLIVLVEAIALRLMKWGNLWRSLLDAFLMNLASTLAGACAFAAGMLSLDPATVWLGLLTGLVLSVAIEGGVLLLLKRQPAHHPPLALRLRAAQGQVWLAALVANLVSYAGLAVVVALVISS